MKRDWWKEFFDSDYGSFHRGRPFQDTERELRLFGKILGDGNGRWLLDACCGPGRHLAGWQGFGWRTVGVDLSDPLLQEAQKVLQGSDGNSFPPVELVRADLSIPFSRPRFSSAVCLFTSIGYSDETWYDQAVLQSIRESLEAGGRLILDVANRDLLIRHPDAIRNWWERDGDVVLEETTFNPLTSRATTRMTRIEAIGVRSDCTYQIRLYSLHEVLELANRVGFKVEEGYGDYAGNGISLGSPRIILAMCKD